MPVSPLVPEFYPRRVYAPGNFCVTNDTCALAFREWLPQTGIWGMHRALRRLHLPAHDGTDAQLCDVAGQIISLASERGFIVASLGAWAPAE